MATLSPQKRQTRSVIEGVGDLCRAETTETAVARSVELLQALFPQAAVRGCSTDAEADFAATDTGGETSGFETISASGFDTTAPSALPAGSVDGVVSSRRIHPELSGPFTAELLFPVDEVRMLVVGTRAPDGFEEADVAMAETVVTQLRETLDGLTAAESAQAVSTTAEIDAAALRRLNEITTAETGFTQTAERLLALGCEYFGLDTGMLAAIDGNDYRVEVVSDATDSHEPGAVYELEHTMCATTVEASPSEPVAFSDVTTTEYDTHPAADRVHAYLAVPIVTNDGLYGTVSFSMQRPRGLPFRDEELEFGTLLGRWLAKAVERRDRLAELRRYETILEAVGDPVYALDTDGRFNFVNEAAREQFGYGQDVIGEHPSIAMHESDVIRIQRQVKSLLEADQRSTRAEFELQTAEGEQMIVENRLALIGDETFQGTAGVLRDITDRIERRQQLESFQQAIEEASDGVAVLEDGEYLYVDDTHAEMYGFESKSQLLGEPWSVLYDDEETERLKTEVFPELAVEGSWRGMVTGSRPDGSTFPAELSLTRLEDGRLVCTVRDETERLERERQQTATVDLLERMYEVTTDQSLSLSEKTEALLTAGAEYLDAEYGFVTEIDEGNATQTITESTGTHELLQPGETCSLPQSYCRKTVETDGILTVQYAPEEGWSEDPAYELFDLDAYIGGSITVNDDVHGTVCFASSTPRDEPFTPTEQSFVSLLRQWVGYEIDRERAQSELSEEREQLQLLIDSVDEYAYVILDEGGQIQTWNNSAQALFGHDPADAVGSPVSLLHAETERSESLPARLVEQARVAGESSDEGWYVRADGTRFYADVRYASLTDDDGTSRGYAVIVHDLTDKRRQRRRRERFVEESDDVVSVLNTDGRITYASGSADRVFGHTPDELTGNNLFDYIHPDDRESTMDAFFGAVQNGTDDAEVDCRFESSDGWRNVEIRCQNMLDDPAIDGMLLYLRDVTESKRRIRRFESIFNQTFQFTGLLEPDGTVIEANDAALTFAGLDRDDLVGELFQETIWWSHSTAVYERLTESIERAAAGEFVRYETDVRGADGLAIIDFSIKPVTDDDGSVVSLVVEGRDVTTQQRQRKHLSVMQRVMRHNMRNDLGKVRGWSELMTAESDPDARREQFQRIENVLAHWHGMVDKMKEIRQLFDSEPRLEPLERIVRETVTAANEAYPDHRIVADTRHSIPVPASVQTAVRELVSNATDVDGVETIEIETVVGDGGWVEIVVRDDGPGLPAVESGVLETGEETPLVHGQGLGLWMVRMIVTQAGGDVSVESGAEGSSIRLQLPTDPTTIVETAD